MSVVSGDIEFRYSGGAGNTDPTAALGGAMSTAAGGLIDNAVKNDLFDDVTPAEAVAGDIEYRGIYIQNQNNTDTLTDARIYISGDSANVNDTIAIALADEAINTAIETIANENTAPVGPVFSHPTDYAGGLQLNGATGLVGDAYKGVWVRRTIGAGAASGAITDNILKVEGTTV